VHVRYVELRCSESGRVKADNYLKNKILRKAGYLCARNIQPSRLPAVHSWLFLPRNLIYLAYALNILDSQNIILLTHIQKCQVVHLYYHTTSSREWNHCITLVSWIKWSIMISSVDENMLTYELLFYILSWLIKYLTNESKEGGVIYEWMKELNSGY